MANYKTSLYKGWDIYKNDDAKTFTYTAWKGSSLTKDRHVSRAETMSQLWRKIDRFNRETN